MGLEWLNCSDSWHQEYNNREHTKPKATDSQMLCEFKLCCSKKNSAVQMQMRTGVKLQISFTIIILMCLTGLSKQMIFGSRHATDEVLVEGQKWVGPPIQWFCFSSAFGLECKTTFSTGPLGTQTHKLESEAAAKGGYFVQLQGSRSKMGPLAVLWELPFCLSSGGHIKL